MAGEDFRRYFDEIVNAVHDGVMIVSKDGVIRMANAAMARMTGFKIEELVGATCTILECDVCEIMRSESEDKWCRLFEREVVSNKRCMLTRKDGSYVSVLKNAKLLKDSSGCVVGALESYSDITELENKDIKIEELTRLLNNDHGFHGMMGQSRVMQEIFQILDKAARSDATILITGETGAGKELVARAVHDLGRRKDGPYVKINCAALNESLIESELFGHTKGAFTGPTAIARGCLKLPTGAIFSWMKSETSHSAPRQNSSGSWKQRNSLTSAERGPSASTCALSPPPTRTWQNSYRKEGSARTSFSGSTFFPSPSHRCGREGKTSPCWSIRLCMTCVKPAAKESAA